MRRDGSSNRKRDPVPRTSNSRALVRMSREKAQWKRGLEHLSPVSMECLDCGLQEAAVSVCGLRKHGIDLAKTSPDRYAYDILVWAGHVAKFARAKRPSMRDSVRNSLRVLSFAAFLASVGLCLATSSYSRHIEAKWMLWRLSRGEPNAVNAAAARLAELRRPETIRPLMNLVRCLGRSRREDFTAAGAMYVLCRCLDLSYQPLLEALSDHDVQERRVAARVFAEVLFLLECAPPDVRFPEIDDQVRPLFSRTMREGVLDGLSKALKDSDAQVRALAARGLRAAKDLDPRFSQILLEALDDPDREVSGSALSALCRVRGLDEEAVKRIVSGLEADDVQLRRGTTFCVRFMTDQAAHVLPKLLIRLSDPDEIVRELAVESLAALGAEHPVVLKALDEASNDPSPRVRRAARTELHSLRRCREESR